MPVGLRLFAILLSQGIFIKLTAVAGKIINEEANMGGITPAVFTFNGIWLLCPPYIFLPTTLFGYCIGIFLWPSSTNMIKAITLTIRATNNKTNRKFISPVLTRPKV